ncbi:MAG TPA: hypothetical protein VKV37_04790 [Ktedonobacteraceae bacterium]|jgi:hypothetical protein|nr:hypothetical protein [Ktedonobacteraceae bacterium]
MGQPDGVRWILAILFLLVVLFATAYLQIQLHFSTYVALVACLLDTIISAAILLGRSEG